MQSNEVCAVAHPRKLRCQSRRFRGKRSGRRAAQKLMKTEYDAVVVGSGPNGLAAAITLAQAGCSVLVLEANSTIGGAARSAGLTRPGFVHDLGSAIHPLAFGSPFFRTLPLQRHGLEWIQPPIALAHPLDGGSAACLRQDLQETNESLGKDERAWRRRMQPFVRDWEKLSAEFLRPMLHLPRHPLALARFGIPALAPAGALAKFWFRGSAGARAFCRDCGAFFSPAGGDRFRRLWAGSGRRRPRGRLAPAARRCAVDQRCASGALARVGRRNRNRAPDRKSRAVAQGAGRFVRHYLLAICAACRGAVARVAIAAGWRISGMRRVFSKSITRFPGRCRGWRRSAARPARSIWAGRWKKLRRASVKSRAAGMRRSHLSSSRSKVSSTARARPEISKRSGPIAMCLTAPSAT